MIAFPIGLALVAAWSVFHDPAFDYRLLALGATVPLLVDLPLRRALAGHSLALSVAVLFGVMLVTRRRRHVRRHAIAVPIGMFFGLVASGMWAHPKVLWWPAFGLTVPRVSLIAPVGVAVLEEVAGIAAIVWFGRRFELTDPHRRQVWLRTGRVS